MTSKGPSLPVLPEVNAWAKAEQDNHRVVATNAG